MIRQRDRVWVLQSKLKTFKDYKAFKEPYTEAMDNIETEINTQLDMLFKLKV